MMRSVLLSTILLVASGCASVPHANYFPQGVLTLEREQRLTEAFAAIGEPSILGSGASGLRNFRLTVLPSSAAVACVTLTDSGFGNMIMRTRIFPSVSSGHPTFDESCVLPDDDWDTFLAKYDQLSESIPTNYPPKLDTFFAETGGTTFVLEGWRSGEYKLFQISDPRPVPFAPHSKAMLSRVFPGVNMSRLEEYVHAYTKLLNWFAVQTKLDVLRGDWGHLSKARCQQT